MQIPEIDKNFEHLQVEENCRKLWDETEVYKYEQDSSKEVFSVDTPPPYVSAAHLHVGHAMSYSQAEFIIRYQRMLGKNIFYPMGFDDNGLPTERFVEKKFNINKKKTSRKEFRELCLQETAEGAKSYEDLWRSMGLSVDWNLRYSTIDEHCQRTSQKSFIDLFNKGLIYRSDEPVLWDTHFETALAQADLDTIERSSKIHDIRFTLSDKSIEALGEKKAIELIIATTRPEFLAGCVALYCNPDDEKYKHLHGETAIVPIYGYEIPIKTSEEVDKDFGTGLMMVSTFPDAEDVKKWREDNLETRICINTNGTMNALAGKYEGLNLDEARSKIVKDLQEMGLLLASRKIKQAVPIAERSERPVEFMMVPQWFIRIMDKKEQWLKRSEELSWAPEFMKVRLDDWINGLKYDWNISRQRFYGVPFPLWTCQDCGEHILAPEENLPVDAAEEKCHLDKCPKCGGGELKGETDVMDTWMTSSLTPLINSNWAETPNRPSCENKMSIRVQGFEIIRTWLFYTMIKSDIHLNDIPWGQVMISGWGLNEQGKKISKRDLDKFTDANGYNRYNPETVIEKFGADALRYWSAGSQLGNDLRYNEKDVKAGRKVVVKLWNVAKFCIGQFGDFDVDAPKIPVAERCPEDRWLLNELNNLTEKMTNGFEKCDYATGKDAMEKFFWQVLCDNYVEIVKDKFWHPERYPAQEVQSSMQTMWEALRQVLSLFAPYLPFVTEELFQLIYAPYESHGDGDKDKNNASVSIHATAWPTVKDEWKVEAPEMEIMLAVLDTVRQLRTQSKLSQGLELEALVIDLSEAEAEVSAQVKAMEMSLQAISRVRGIKYESAGTDCGVGGVRLGVEQ